MGLKKGFPTRMVSHMLSLETVSSRSVDRIIPELLERLYAEDNRMRRLLPEPPVGMHWESSTEMSQDIAAHGDTVYRIVYRLREDY